MRTFATPIVLVALGLAALAGLTACGGSGGGSTTPAAAGGTTATASTGTTVSQKNVSGVGEILVDSKGDALYSAEQESGSAIKCTDSCTEIWIPLTVSSSGSTPTGVSGLALVRRPDGTSQVTYKGDPLYTFAQDTSPGEVNGNGVSDSFGGTDFTWHVAGQAGASTTTGSGTGSYGY
jgi:predicted lipoprotein with Yx(FWY)xxD motif